jgi:hypothetical protein
MKRDMCSLDLERLKELYSVEYNGLTTALLNGESWEDLIDQRKRITEITREIYKKKQYEVYSNPAESALNTNR